MSMGSSMHRTTPLTRQEMERIIDGNGSVMLPNGQIIEQKHFLPSDAQLAVGDPAKEAQAMEKMRKQVEDLQRQMEALQSGNLKGLASAPSQAPPLTNATLTHEQEVLRQEALRQEAQKAAQREAMLKANNPPTGAQAPHGEASGASGAAAASAPHAAPQQPAPAPPATGKGKGQTS